MVEIEKFKVQLNSLKRGVGAYKRDDIGLIEFEGSDALEYLNRISSNNVHELEKGKIAASFFLNEKGKILDFCRILNGENNKFISYSLTFGKKTLFWINKFLLNENCKFEDASTKFDVIEIRGEQKESFLDFLCKNDVGALPENQIINSEIENFHFSLARLKDIGETDYFWAIITSERSGDFLELLDEKKGAFDFRVIEPDVYEFFRVSAGIPKTPNEINDERFPVEICADKFISFEKRNYIGREAIARFEKHFENEKYQIMKIELEEICEAPEERIKVTVNGEKAGFSTSIAVDPIENKTYALAYVNSSYLKEEGVRKFEVLNGDKINIQIIRE